LRTGTEVKLVLEMLILLPPPSSTFATPNRFSTGKVDILIPPVELSCGRTTLDKFVKLESVNSPFIQYKEEDSIETIDPADSQITSPSIEVGPSRDNWPWNSEEISIELEISRQAASDVASACEEIVTVALTFEGQDADD
jgi:hypothetical protein